MLQYTRSILLPLHPQLLPPPSPSLAYQPHCLISSFSPVSAHLDMKSFISLVILVFFPDLNQSLQSLFSLFSHCLNFMLEILRLRCDWRIQLVVPLGYCEQTQRRVVQVQHIIRFLYYIHPKSHQPFAFKHFKKLETMFEFCCNIRLNQHPGVFSFALKSGNCKVLYPSTCMCKSLICFKLFFCCGFSLSSGRTSIKLQSSCS